MRERPLNLDEYGISKERYLELKHFCKRYTEMRLEIASARGLDAVSNDGLPHGNGKSDPTARKAEIREKKHRRIRHHLNGTATTPRLAVFRSNKHMYAQIIDDTVGKTLVSASTLQKDVKAELENTDDVKAAAYLGTVIGKKAVEAGIESVVFDRGGYIYHGKVKALADAAREAGLKF